MMLFILISKKVLLSDLGVLSVIAFESYFVCSLASHIEGNFLKMRQGV